MVRTGTARAGTLASLGRLRGGFGGAGLVVAVYLR